MLQKVFSKRINKDYWASKKEEEEFEKDGLPIFDKKDIAELKIYNPTNDELLKIWVKKSFEKVSVASVVEELRRSVEKELSSDLYKRTGNKLSPNAQLALQQIKKVLGGTNGDSIQGEEQPQEIRRGEG